MTVRRLSRVWREIFARLRKAKYIKVRATSDEVAIEFAGKVKRMVRVQHSELRDQPPRNGKDVRYEPRPLLSSSDNDISTIENMIINALE